MKDQLDQAGIACELRNEATYSNFPGAPFQPEVWVINDDDYAEACRVRDAWRQSEPSAPLAVPKGMLTGTRSDLVCCALAAVLAIALAIWLLMRFVRTDEESYVKGAVFFGLIGVTAVAIGFGLWRSRRSQ